MRKTSITRSISTEQIDQDCLEIYAVKTTKTGSVRSVTYIDLSTGELIEAKDLSIGVVDLRQKIPARANALNSLRPEVRTFALFVLRFANKRRGITPGIDMLCQWFAELNDKQSGHVRRYIPALMKAGILAGDALLGPLFQRTGGEARSHLGEDFRAWCNLQMLKRDGLELTSTPQPSTACPVFVAAEVARLDAALEADQIVWAWQTFRPTRPTKLRPAPDPHSSPLCGSAVGTDVECVY